MTQVEQLAAFAANASPADLTERAVHELKIRVLDALGCAIGAQDGEPIRLAAAHLAEFGGAERCTLIGGGRTSPDRAAFYNSALVRYLDFNDNYLAEGETCHPSDNLGAVLAASEYAGSSGREFLTALAVAYQVQCRLSDVAPVRARGFDHTTQGSYSVAAGVSRALRLDRSRTAHALAISGTAYNELRVSRTGALSHWKGLAFPNNAFGCTHATFLAMRGITGPGQVFEGNKGFMDSIAGTFEINWSEEGLDRVTRTILKRYNAEIHSQSALEAVLDLKHRHSFTPAEVTRVEVEIFEAAFNIIGGGEEGDKTVVQTKEQADHSLPFLIAVALLDDQVMPEQYRAERIRRQDVQALLRKVSVRPREDYSRRFPEEMPCCVKVSLEDGQTLAQEKSDYEGFHTRPKRWEAVRRKFERLAAPSTEESLRGEIAEAVSRLETIPITDLTRLLARVGTGSRA